MSIDNIAAFWRRAPSAMFPICLGAIGAGLLWRKAAETLGAPAAIGEVWLALASGRRCGNEASPATGRGAANGG